MNWQDYLPHHVRQAMTYAEPGSWMPTLPQNCIRLSAGYPAASVVPALDLADAARRLVEEEHDVPLQYLGSKHMYNLRRRLMDRLAQRGISAREDEFMLTAGAYQAIDLVAHILLDRHTPVMVEAPTYMEALETFHNYTDDILSVPMDEGGIVLEALANLLEHRATSGQPMPKLLYTIPNFHNPTGRLLADDRRTRLLELAEKYDFLILEDDAYGELYFGGSAPAPLKSLDGSDRVMYIGSLSKVVAPGLRIGWIVAAGPLVKAMNWFKKDLDHSFMESITDVYLDSFDFEARLLELRNAYRLRRDVMLGALQAEMPSEVSWETPQGGFFIWLTIPSGDTSKLLPHALDAGVSYVPGVHFFDNPTDGRQHLRLSFSNVLPDAMVEGVKRLAAVVKKES